jgi:hypothetical protein
MWDHQTVGKLAVVNYRAAPCFPNDPIDISPRCVRRHIAVALEVA